MRQKLQIWYNTRTWLNTGVCHGVLVVMRALTLYSLYRVSKQHVESVSNQESVSLTPDPYRLTSNSTATQCMMCNKFSICWFFWRQLDKILSLCVLMRLINIWLCEIVNKFSQWIQTFILNSKTPRVLEGTQCSVLILKLGN